MDEQSDEEHRLNCGPRHPSAAYGSLSSAQEESSRDETAAKIRANMKNLSIVMSQIHFCVTQRRE